MKNQPLASIGVPVYNGGEYLEECLRSILEQTYQNWECVIVDNRSTDETNRIARSFTERDSRFRLIENSDFVDQTTNWNISFRNIDSGARYFKIVPADDWIFPEYLERMIEAMERHPGAGICSSYRLMDRWIKCDRLDYYDGTCFDGKIILVEQLLHKLELTGSINTVLYRVDTLKKVTGYPDIFKMGIYHIDTDLAYEVQSFSDQAFVYQVLSYTRRHNETYTSQISHRFQTSLYLREMELYKYRGLDPILEKEYKKVRRKYALFLLQQKLKGDKELIQWHRKYLDPTRRIKWHESLKALLLKLYYTITWQRNSFG
jgi:glycosyltransferase involved in cell wall biosynthesis